MKKHLKQIVMALGAVVMLGVLTHCAMPSQTSSPEEQAVSLNQPALSVQANLQPGTVIKPNHVSQTVLDNDLGAYYQYWKTKYLMTSNGNTPGGGYYIKADSTGGHAYPIKSNSESHGYGMIIFALMNDRQVFDGMYNMYDKHRSKINNHLMSWVITKDEFASQDSDSAADGDLDIAYALLLAHEKWGSDGQVNYLSEAKRIITLGIKESDMSKTSKRVMLGDWDTNQYSTRPSDWMAGHMRAYYLYTNDTFWLEAADTIYSIVDTITAKYAGSTGLMPDFVINATPQPAQPNFLESKYDGDYYYNACRFPWRIAVDYAHYGTPEAKASVSKIVNWLKGQTNGNPANIKSGFTLQGQMLADSDYFSTAFAAPFVAACVVDPSFQSFLNAGWESIKKVEDSYYEDTINLLCMAFISGNWPSVVGPDVDDITPPTVPQNLKAETAGSTVSLSWTASTDDRGVTGYKIFQNGTFLTSTAATSFDVTGLSQGTYSYKVSAYDAAGNESAQSAPAAAEIGDIIAPSIPANLSGTVSGTTITLSWSACTDNVGVTGYKVHQNGPVVKTVTTTSCTITGLKPGTYNFQICAVDAAGNVSDKCVPVQKVIPDTEAPSVPQNVKAIASGSTISVSLNASTDNAGVAGYKIYQNGSFLVSTTGTLYNVTNLAPGTYTYTVSAYDAAGNESAKSAPASATVEEIVQELTVTIKKTGGWGNTIQGDIIIENSSSTTVNTWSFSADFDFSITSSWCGQISSNGNSYTILPQGWNARLTPGAKATVGFIATGSLTSGSVTNAVLNGKSVVVKIIE